MANPASSPSWWPTTGSTAAWPLRTLGELAEFSNGLNFTQKDSGYRIRVLGVKDFQDNVLASLNDVATISIGRKLPNDGLTDNNNFKPLQPQLHYCSNTHTAWEV